MSHDLPATRWAHACVLAIEKALGRPFSGEDAAKVQMALLNPPWQPMDIAPKQAALLLLCEDGMTVGGWFKHNHVPIYGWVRTERLGYEEDVQGISPVAWLPLPPVPDDDPPPPQEQA